MKLMGLSRKEVRTGKIGLGALVLSLFRRDLFYVVVMTLSDYEGYNLDIT